jgi:hypothetical protein
VASCTALSLIVPPRRRAPNRRTVWIIAGSVVAVAVIGVLLANTADSGNNGPKPKAKGNKPAPAVPKSNQLTLEVGKVVVQNAGPPAKVTRAIRRTLLSSTQSYVDGAILAPLERGQVNNQYAKVFDGGVR